MPLPRSFLPRVPRRSPLSVPPGLESIRARVRLRLLATPEQRAWIETVAAKLPKVGGNPDRNLVLSHVLAVGFEALGIGRPSPFLELRRERPKLNRRAQALGQAVATDDLETNELLPRFSSDPRLFEGGQTRPDEY